MDYTIYGMNLRLKRVFLSGLYASAVGMDNGSAMNEGFVVKNAGAQKATPSTLFPRTNIHFFSHLLEMMEKGWQQGGRMLCEEGYHLESIVIVESMD